MGRLVLGLLCVLVLSPPTMASQPASCAQLAGSWIYARMAGNGVHVNEFELVEGRDGLAGDMTYLDGGLLLEAVFTGFEMHADGKVVFTSRISNGQKALHEGVLSEDGNTVRGDYKLGFGVGGRFVLNRAGVEGSPLMSGKWEYCMNDSSGGPDRYADVLLLGDTFGRFDGLLYYRGFSSVPREVRGTVSEDGYLRFDVLDNGIRAHEGKMLPDKISAEGTWSDAGDDHGTFTLRMISSECQGFCFFCPGRCWLPFAARQGIPWLKGS